MGLNIGLPTDGVPNRGWKIWVTSTAMVSCAAILVTIRVVTRCFRGGIKCDDWTIIAALICSILLTVTENMAVSEGYGKHDWDVPKEHRIKALQWFFAAQVFYKLVIVFAKCSIVFLYLRIFSIEKSFRWACNALILVNLLSGFAFIIATVFQCRPVKAFWDRSIPNYTCIDHFSFWMSYSVINIITDFIILCLPIQQIARLQLRKEDKVALIFVFGLGGFVCITSIIRATTIAASSSSTDATWSPIPATIWSVVECNTGIICACTPMIRQPLSALFPRVFVSLARGSSNAPMQKSRANTPRSRLSFEPPLVTSASAPWDSEEQLHTMGVSREGGYSNSTART
ncbi:hypothetical protein FQN49_003901 [Arthroderma sp. PD_2]|nr:hypothetical protein FQN49_003901 [Arthroderma sp. PD_2]